MKRSFCQASGLQGALIFGRRARAQTQGQTIVDYQMSAREKLLAAIIAAESGAAFGVVGLILLYFEFTHPGFCRAGSHWRHLSPAVGPRLFVSAHQLCGCAADSACHRAFCRRGQSRRFRSSWNRRIGGYGHWNADPCRLAGPRGPDRLFTALSLALPFAAIFMIFLIAL